MTKLKELKAARAAALSAAADAYASPDAAAGDWDAVYDAYDVWNAAYDAYEAELKKQREKKNELALSTNEAHRA